ncbi:MAG: Mur ligase family protein [Actinomycetota bacterium]|nr:Mur ligase family protein [Actinomycetota bacterium]
MVIGITGSAGKTTTKDMLASILGESHDIGFTPKNYNNEIGVPKAILNLGKHTDFFIAEIAMRKKGQMKQLSQLIGPDIGIITSVGEAHLQFFKNVRGNRQNQGRNCF